MSSLKYIAEFNKIVHNIDFFSIIHDVSLSNKLILIQNDLSDEDINFDSFEMYNFFSNIYHILNHSSDYKSNLISGCIDVLLKATSSRNKTLKGATNFINFLPAMVKLILITQEDNDEKLIKVLKLINNFLRITGELDEHNTKLIIETLREYLENSTNDCIIHLVLNIFVNLAMKNSAAKYHVARIVTTPGLQNKMDKANDVISAKFHVLMFGEISPKDFYRMISVSFKNITSAIKTFDCELIEHSIDLLENSQGLQRQISENNENLQFFDELLESLNLTIENNSNLLPVQMLEFFEGIFIYFSQLLKFDNNLAVKMENFVNIIFENDKFYQLPKALNFLTTFIEFGGNMTSIEETLEKIIMNFLSNELKTLNESKIALLKLIQILQLKGQLVNVQNALMKFIDTLIRFDLEEIKVDKIEGDQIFLTVHLIKTLSVLSSDFNLSERLDRIFSLDYLPIVITKAYMSKDEETLTTLFSINSLEKFPSQKVAHMLSTSSNFFFNELKNDENRVKYEVQPLTGTSAYINRQMGQELNDLIAKINEKLDNNESIDTLDTILLYRHKNNYHNEHLNDLNVSVQKFTNLCNKLQHQNAMVRKICEKQEIQNWCLQMDKEKLNRDKINLFEDQKRLKSSILTFQNRIAQENQAKVQVHKLLTAKEVQYDSELIELLIEINLPN